MSILKNAVESIQIGMEDYHNDDERRVLSAIRNLYAGVLLLFKCKLQELSDPDSDEALLKTKVMPVLNPITGSISWTGKGKKTVEVQDIIDRLNSLGVDGIEWDRLQKLQQIRNDIEHYFSQAPIVRMKEAVANSLHLIMQICEPHLDMRPVDVLGQQCWDMMLSVGSIYDAELKSCKDNLNSVTWPFDEVRAGINLMRCPECESQLLKVTDTDAERDNITFQCSSCQEESLYADVVGPVVEAQMEGRNYVSVKDGGEREVDYCPECGAGTFLTNEEECAACFYKLEYSNCVECGERLSVDEQCLEGRCSYCEHRWQKILAE